MGQNVVEKMGIVTGRSSSVVARRASELDMDVVVQGAADKLRSIAVSSRSGNG